MSTPRYALLFVCALGPCLFIMYGYYHFLHCPNISMSLKDHVVRAQLTSETIVVNYRNKLKFLMEPPRILDDLCSKHCNNSGVQWRMVTFVKSRSQHFRERETLRRTWASVRTVNNTQFRTIFVVGQTSSKKDKNLLMDEQQRYDDILQYDGPDDYKNIMLKTLAGMQWASDNLPRHFFYSSADDDVVVNLATLQREVDAAQNKMSKDKWSEYPLLCAYGIMPHDAPHREKGSKWLIHKFEYPWHVWPVSCYGGFYTTRVSLVVRLYEESRTLPLLRFDDVWITGIVRQHLGMPSDMVLPPGDANTVHHLEKKENMNDLWTKVMPDILSHNACLCKC